MQQHAILLVEDEEPVARGVRYALEAEGCYAPSGLGSAIVRGDLIVDVERHRVTRAGGPVELTATEFEILRELARHPGRVFSREALLRAVRNDSDWLGDETTVTVHIR